MKNKTVNINNFIGVYDNYITEDECKKAINLYETQDKFNQTMNRIGFENSPVLEKQDQQLFLGEGNIEVWWETLKTMMLNFNLAWVHYITNTGAEESYKRNKATLYSFKDSKTLPTEGYHVWHIEHGAPMEMQSRAFVFSIYLNDVEEGGETEFLHFSKRVKPKTGRIVIWPAGFPYLHRGNSPLSGEKYILTSWMRLVP